VTTAASIDGARGCILDGAALARHLRDRARAESEALGGRPAALRVILLGNDAASETYVAAKTKAAREAGIRAETVRLPSGSSPEALLDIRVGPARLPDLGVTATAGSPMRFV
jgi:hypothetical protein